MNNFFIESSTTRDSNDNIIRETNYTYDDNGNLTATNNPLLGLFASDSTLTYDENDNLIRRRTFSLSNNFSTTFITDFTYDDSGNLLTETIGDSSGSDPAENPESITRYSYDDRNNVILQSIDSNADSVIDTEVEFTYDDNNNLLTQTNNQLNDNTSIIVKTYEYDNNNNLIVENNDIDSDGVTDYIKTYEYDDNNNLLVEGIDFDLNGIPNNITTNTYDENNNLITIEFESDFTEDSITTNTYDSNNNLITSTLDNNRDGTIETINENSYLQIGELSTEEIDESNLSLTPVHRFFQYELGFHLYTADSNEIESVRRLSNSGELAYNYEAEQYQVLADNRDAITGEIIEEAKPVYRFFNTDTGAHLYTTDTNEKDSIQANLPNYNFEGIQYYAFESELDNLDTIPVYRLLNNTSGSHLYSSDTNEINFIEENSSNFVTENNGDPVFYVFDL